MLYVVFGSKIPRFKIKHNDVFFSMKLNSLGMFSVLYFTYAILNIAVSARTKLHIVKRS